MKVLLASEWFAPDVGGVSSHVRDLAINLSNRGHEVIVLTRKKEGRKKKIYELIELEQIEYLRIFHSFSGNGILKIFSEFMSQTWYTRIMRLHQYL